LKGASLSHAQLRELLFFHFSEGHESRITFEQVKVLLADRL